MDTKELEKMVEDTCVKAEQYLGDNLPRKWLDIHDDIVGMTIYLMDPEGQNEHSTNEILKTLARCRTRLEWGDKIIIPIRPVKLEYTIFGSN